MQPTPPATQPTLEDTYSTSIANSTASSPLPSSKKRKTEPTLSYEIIEKIRKTCLDLQNTVQQQQQTIDNLEREFKQISENMPKIGVMTLRGVSEDKVSNDPSSTFQPLEIEIEYHSKTGQNSVLTVVVDKLKSRKKCRFIQDHLNLNPNLSCIRIDLLALNHTDFDPKLIADMFIYCQSHNVLSFTIDDSNLENIRSIAIWLGIDKLIERCDRILTASFDFKMIDLYREKSHNDASLSRLLAIQLSEPTNFLGAKIAQFIFNLLLVAPTIDTELCKGLMNYKHYMEELVLGIDTSKNFNISLLKDVFNENQTLKKLNLLIYNCKREISSKICTLIAEIKNLREVRIGAADTPDIIHFAELLAQTNLKLDLLQLKQLGEEESECKLIQLPVGSLTEKFELKHPYVLNNYKQCKPQNVTCNSFPFNPCGFGSQYDDEELDLSLEELEFVVACPAIRELVFDKSFKSQYLDTASTEFFSALAKSNISTLVLPPPHIIKQPHIEEEIDFTVLKSLFAKIDTYNATLALTKIDQVTLLVSASKKYKLVDIKHLFSSFKVSVKLIK